MTRIITIIVIISLLLLPVAQSFNTYHHHHYRSKHMTTMVSKNRSPSSFHDVYSEEDDDDDDNDTIEITNFWGTQIIQQNNPNKLPCVPTLDPVHGMLPHGAYTLAPTPTSDPKPTCRISLLLPPQQQLQQQQDAYIRICQNYLESGFQTFQGASQEFIQQFHAQTPSKIVGSNTIHWVMKYKVPTTMMQSSTTTMVRQQILSLLDPMAAAGASDAIDTLIVQYNPKSPYHLDVLDICTELQREGWIRSIGIENFPTDLVEAAVHDCGFSIQLIQQDSNLLVPTTTSSSSSRSSGSSSSTTTILLQQPKNTWMTNALVGGLLTNPSYAEWRNPPSLHGQWKSTIREWGIRQGIINAKDDYGPSNNRHKYKTLDRTLWLAFQEQVLDVLQDMAWRYGVSIKCIVIRWAMETGVATVVLPAFSNTHHNNDDDSPVEWKRHVKEMRMAFSFCLEEDDKELLATLGKDGNKNKEEDDYFMDLQEMEEMLVREGLPEHEIEKMLKQQEKRPTLKHGCDSNNNKIDFNNPTLWL